MSRAIASCPSHACHRSVRPGASAERQQQRPAGRAGRARRDRRPGRALPCPTQHDLARGAELVEQPRARSPRTRAGRTSRSSTLAGSGTPSSWAIDLGQSIDARRAAHPMPVPGAAGSGRRRRLDRLDLAAQARQRAAAKQRAAPRGRTTRARRRPAGTRRAGACPAASSRSSALLDDADRQAPARGRRRRPGTGPWWRAQRASSALERHRRPARGRPRPRPAAAPRRARRGSAPTSSIAIQRSSPAMRTRDRPPVGGQRLAATPLRRARADARPCRARGPRPRRRPGRPGAAAGRGRRRPSRLRAPSVSAWSSSSTSASASASSSSRSSSAPSSSRSRSRSSASAWARRSSERRVALVHVGARCSRTAASWRTGEARRVSTLTRRISRRSMRGQDARAARAGRRRPGGTRGRSRG